MIIVIILLVVIAVLLLFLGTQYNALVRLRNRVEAAWAQIDVQLRRRYDLIPNLIETVKGYAAHEKDTFEAVIAARNGAVAAANPADQAEAENMLTATLGKLFALREDYPDLKANENFLKLQEELTATEDRIAYSRQYYNDATLKYNNKRETFPSNIVAGMFNFGPREYFETVGDAAEPVQVQF